VATITTYSWQDFVDAMIATASTATPNLTDFTPGSIALAMFMAVAGVATMLQSMILTVQNGMRLQTSQGSQVDSFLADWGASRQDSRAATGQVTLGRILTAATIHISPGAVIQTSVDRIKFNIVADPGNITGNWDSGSSTYIFPSGQSTLNVLVQAVVSGSGGNIIANTLTQIVSGLGGVNTVFNALPFTTGLDTVSDDSAKADFQQSYIPALGTGNYAAIARAVKGVGGNLTHNVIPQQHLDGSAFVSGYTVTVDDGTGAISGATLTAVATALDSVRAAGDIPEVQAPNNLLVNVQMHMLPSSTSVASVVQAAVQASISDYMNNLGAGATVVSFADVLALAQSVPSVLSVTGLQLNGTGADVPVTPVQLPRIGTVTFV